MVKAPSTIVMEIYTREIIDIIRLMGMECMPIRMEPGMKETGKMTCNMEKELNYSKTVQSTKADTLAGRKTATVSTTGQTVLYTLGIGWTTRSTVWGVTSGTMDASIMATGIITIWTEQASMSGLMEEGMKEPLLKIRKKALDYITGKMVEDMKVGGHLESNMA